MGGISSGKIIRGAAAFSLTSGNWIIFMCKRFLLFIMLVFSMCVVVQATEVQFETGQNYYEKGEYQKAYQIFFKLFENDPENIKINYHLGKAAFGMKDYEAAVMAFERVLIFDPDAAQAKLELAKSYYRLGSRETAAQYFEEVLKSDLPQDVKKNIQKILTEIREGSL